MPCYTIQRSTLELANVAINNPHLIRAALEAIGANVSEYRGTFRATIDGVDVTVRDGKVTMREGQEGNIATRINRAVGMEAARASYKAQGWSFNQTSETTYKAEKRGGF